MGTKPIPKNAWTNRVIVNKKEFLGAGVLIVLMLAFLIFNKLKDTTVITDTTPIAGCRDSIACNYDSNATVDSVNQDGESICDYKVYPK